MGKAIPAQHPAVVLRSHYNHMRALLAVAMIAVAGLTAALMTVANDSDEVSSKSSARPIKSINYGDSNYVNPSTGYPSATSRPESPGTRFDGGPEAGSRGIRQSSAASAAPVYVNPSTGYASTRYDGGPEEGTSRALSSGADSSTVPGIRYDGGPEEGTSGAGH